MSGFSTAFLKGVFPRLRGRFARGGREPSDWVNPIVLKELRQGMRSRSFMLVFFLVQLAMVLFIIFGLATSSAYSSSAQRELAQIFWTMVGAFLLIILPVMGLNSLGSELREGRIDLLVLSRLKSRRIVVGKWFALLLQGVLVVSSLMPYLVVRYFAGAVDFVGDLKTLGALSLAAVLVVGLAVSFSAVRSKLVRGVCYLIGAGGLVALIDSPLRFLRGMDLVELALFVILAGPPTVLLALEVSAARFTPLAENHETRKRVLAILVFAIGYGFILAGVLEELVARFLFGLVLVSSWNALLREPVRVPGVYRPFVRFGWAGKTLGRLLFYPGWPTGVFFTVLAFSTYYVLVWFPATESLLVAVWLPAMVGVFLVPLAIARALARRSGAPIGRLMLFLQGAFVIFGIFVFVLREGTKIDLGLFSALVPTGAIERVLAGQVGEADLFAYAAVSTLVMAVAIGVLVREIRGEWSGVYRPLEEAAERVRREAVAGATGGRRSAAGSPPGSRA